MYNEEPELMTVSEVARLLRVDTTTVRRWVNAEALPAVSLPHMGRRHSIRIRRSTVQAILTGAGHAS